MKQLTESYQTEDSFTPVEQREISACDEQDHMILWDTIISLIPEDNHIELVLACEKVASYIKEQRENAAKKADHKARVDEIDRLLGHLIESYPYDADNPYFSKTLTEYRIVSERFRVLTKQSRITNDSNQLKHAA